MLNALTRWWEQRARPASRAVVPPQLLALFTSGPTDSGAVVSPETALSLPSVFACCQVLSQDLARTPVRLRQKVDADTYVDAVDHPLYEILATLVNPEMTAYEFKHLMQWQLLTYGRAFAEVVRADGRIIALWPLDSAAMSVDRTAAGVKRWTYMGGQVYTWLFDASAPPILELTMETPLVRCREVIGAALALQQYTAKYFANSARPSGILHAAGSISDETASRLSAYWAANYGGSANRGKTPVIDAGMKFEPIQSSNDDAQAVELQRALNEQIAGVFRVPVWKIGDLTKANYSNMESSSLDYICSALDPLFELWEEALKRDLLTSRQFNQYTMAFDRRALVRNDMQSLNASLQSGIQNGYLSQNEARKALGLNPIEGGDTFMVNSALQPVGAKEPHVA